MVASGEIQPGDILERVSRLEVRVESLSESAAQRFDDMNRRLDDMSRRIDELSRRVDTVAGELRREMRSGVQQADLPDPGNGRGDNSGSAGNAAHHLMARGFD